MAQKGGPCLRGQRLLDNAPCQAVAGPDSGALLLPRYCASLVQTKADRHANGSPSGGAGEEQGDETERARPLPNSSALRSYRSDKKPAYRCACGSFAPGLPSPSLLRNATSPKGRGFGRAQGAKNPPWRSQLLGGFLIARDESAGFSHFCLYYMRFSAKVKHCTESLQAPSQALRASSPRGRAFGRPGNFPLDA